MCHTGADVTSAIYTHQSWGVLGGGGVGRGLGGAGVGRGCVRKEWGVLGRGLGRCGC